MTKIKTLRALIVGIIAALTVSLFPNSAQAAVAYKFVDEKLGLSSGGGLQTGTADWVASTVYAVGNVVRNGGFYYKCSVAGTSASSIGPSPNTLADNTVTWVLGNSAMPTTTTDTAQAHELGYIALALDPTYGIGEFIYVKFTGITVAGDFVTFDRFNKTATQTAAAAPGANKYLSIGISMGSQTATSFGWVMIRGVHDQANVTAALTTGTVLTGSATAGRCNQAVANYVFDSAVLRGAGVVGTGTVELYWPTCSSR
jgi:hypothetical protein